MAMPMRKASAKVGPTCARLGPIQRQPTGKRLRRFNTFDMIKWQYTEGVKDTSLVAPETYQLAHAAVERIGVKPKWTFA